MLTELSEEYIWSVEKETAREWVCESSNEGTSSVKLHSVQFIFVVLGFGVGYTQMLKIKGRMNLDQIEM